MINSIYVFGSGYMGSGIAQVYAQSKIDVLLYGINGDVLKKAINQISWSLKKLYEKGKILEESEIIKERIKELIESLERLMGVFETSHMVGLDVIYGALMSMYRQTGDPRWFPLLLIRRMVEAGFLGRKTGRGWYQYNPNGTKREN